MRLKRIIIGVSMVLALLSPAIVPAAGAGAATPQRQQAQQQQGGGSTSCGNANTAKGEVLQGIGETGNNCDDSQVDNVFRTIVQLLSMIVGIASIIVIIYAGLKYITSGGEQARVASAKSTLLYALVGVAIAALAQLMVHFVLFQANKA
jgi:uncharacterized protein (DUF2345 family)